MNTGVEVLEIVSQCQQGGIKRRTEENGDVCKRPVNLSGIPNLRRHGESNNLDGWSF